MTDQKVRVDPIRATDAVVATDQNGVILIFTRPIYAPGEMDKPPEMAPSAAVSIPWALADRIAAIIADRSANRTTQASASPPPPEEAKGRLN